MSNLGKNTCSVAGLDVNGAVVLRRGRTGEGLVAFASKLSACIVAMEAVKRAAGRTSWGGRLPRKATQSG